MNDENGQTGRGDDRLDSWKRIATYLRRGVRTVRRWESEEGLPVHRHPHKSQRSVYAYKTEIDAWLDERSQRPRNTPAPPPQTMLAVLPFENLSGDDQQEYFSDGLTEEMIACLGQVPRSDLGVIARTSAMIYKGANKSIEDIGRELGVQYVLEGSVRRADERVRITAQLIRVSDQTHIWAHNYEQPLTSILELQREISLEIAAEIRRRLVKKAAPAVPAETVPARPIGQEAYENYLKGRYLLYRMTEDSLPQSIECFQQVIDAEPGFAAAYAGQAEALQLLSIFAPLSPSGFNQRGLEAAVKAVSIDPKSAESFAALGLLHSCYTWDWDAAHGVFKRAIELNPSLAMAYQWYAEFLAVLGEFDAALANVERAQQLDPMSLAVACSRGHCLWLARQAHELIPAMERVIDMEPRFPLAHILRIMGYAIDERYDDCVRATRQAMADCGEQSHFLAIYGYSAAMAGQTQLAEEQLQRLRMAAQDSYVPAFNFAAVNVGLRRDEETLNYLCAAYEERTWHITTLATNFMFDPLRDAPRFKTLLEKLQLKEPDS